MITQRGLLYLDCMHDFCGDYKTSFDKSDTNLLRILNSKYMHMDELRRQEYSHIQSMPLEQKRNHIEVIMKEEMGFFIDKLFITIFTLYNQDANLTNDEKIMISNLFRMSGLRASTSHDFEDEVLRLCVRTLGINDITQQEPCKMANPQFIGSERNVVKVECPYEIIKKGKNDSVRLTDAKELYTFLSRIFVNEGQTLVFVKDANPFSVDKIQEMNPNNRIIYNGLMTDNDASKGGVQDELCIGPTLNGTFFPCKDPENISYSLETTNNELMFINKIYRDGNKKVILVPEYQDFLQRDIKNNSFTIQKNVNSINALGRELYAIFKLFNGYDGRKNNINDINTASLISRVLNNELYKTYGITVAKQVVEETGNEQEGIALKYEDYVKCLFDIKGSGDRLQIKATAAFNTMFTDHKAVFLSEDRCAIAYAAITGVPCVLISTRDLKMVATAFNINMVSSLALGMQQAKIGHGGMMKTTSQTKSVSLSVSSNGSSKVTTQISQSKRNFEKLMNTEVSPMIASILMSNHESGRMFFERMADANIKLTLFDYIRLRFVWMHMLPSNVFHQLEKTKIR